MRIRGLLLRGTSGRSHCDACSLVASAASPLTALPLILVVLGVWPLGAQAPSPATADRQKVMKVAADIMAAAGFCDLITIGLDGQPQSRVIQPQAPDDQFVVWMGTNPLTRKVREVEKDPRVTLTYFDKPGNRFVTLLGRASIVRDPAEKAKHWTEAWKPFYKDTYRGDDFVLLKFTASRLEVVSAADGIVNDPRTWRPVTVTMKR